MTRILLLSPADFDFDADTIPAGITDSDTTTVHRRVAYASCPPVGAHDWALAELAVMAAGQKAQSEGFDAVCLADFGDYGANALRSLLDIPVVTAGRSAMLHALTLGSRFSVLATGRDINRIKKTVHEYGLDAQCAGIHTQPAEDDIGTLGIEGDVLILAGAARLAGLTGLAVPVVDPLALVLKLAESLDGLGLSHSRRAYPAPEVRKNVLIESLAAPDG